MKRAVVDNITNTPTAIDVIATIVNATFPPVSGNRIVPVPATVEALNILPYISHSFG